MYNKILLIDLWDSLLFREKEKDKFKLITARDATKTEKELYKKKVKY